MTRTPTTNKRCASSRPLRVIFSMNQCPLSGLLRANWHFSLHLRCHHKKAIEKQSGVAGHIFKGGALFVQPPPCGIMNQSDTAHFDFLLRRAVMDATKTSNRFTMPEPSITPYDPVYYPTQPTPMFPDTTTFNFVDQTFNFNFNFAFPTTLNDARLYSRNNPYMQEDVVPTHISVFPEDINSMLIS